MKILYFEDQEDDRDLLIETFIDEINNDVEFMIVWLGEYPQEHDYTDDRWKIVPGEGARIYTREGLSEAPVDPLHPGDFDAAILDMFRASGVFDGEAFTKWLGQGNFLGPVILHSRYEVPAEVPNLPSAHVISKQLENATVAVVHRVIEQLEARPIRPAEGADQPLAAFWASIRETRNPPDRWLAYWTASADSETGGKVMSFFRQRPLYREGAATWPEKLAMLVREGTYPNIVWVSCESVNDGIVKEIDHARDRVESLRDHLVERKSEALQKKWRQGIGNGAARAELDSLRMAESRIPYRYPLVAALANRIDQRRPGIDAHLLKRGAVAVARDQLLDCSVGWLEQSVENFIHIYESLLEHQHFDALQEYYRRYLRLLIAGRRMSYVYPNSRHTSLLEEFSSTRAGLPQTMPRNHREWRLKLVEKGLLSEAAANAFK